MQRAAVLEEIAQNQPRARGGVNLVWLNGIALEEKDLTPLGCVSRCCPSLPPSIPLLSGRALTVCLCAGFYA